jgi:hypothetical protein
VEAKRARALTPLVAPPDTKVSNLLTRWGSPTATEILGWVCFFTKLSHFGYETATKGVVIKAHHHE